MSKFDKIIFWFLGLGLPVVVGAMIWANSIVGNGNTLYTDKYVKSAENYSGGLWNILGIFFISWVLLAIITLIRILLNSKLREAFLIKATRVQERDEREVEISGFAAKFSFFANLALLVCLLFFSSLNVSAKKYNKDFLDDKGNTKHGYLTMGFGLRAFDEKAITIKKDNEIKEINYSELPISKSGIILLLIFWQVGMYHFSARKKSAIL
jgi:hypothetical protein